jgi:hypothetical protein
MMPHRSRQQIIRRVERKHEAAEAVKERIRRGGKKKEPAEAAKKNPPKRVEEKNQGEDGSNVTDSASPVGG